MIGFSFDEKGDAGPLRVYPLSPAHMALLNASGMMPDYQGDVIDAPAAPVAGRVRLPDLGMSLAAEDALRPFQGHGKPAAVLELLLSVMHYCALNNVDFPTVYERAVRSFGNTRID